MAPVFKATEGGLWAAAAALAAASSPRIGFITGFFVPSGDPPAAETDGPAGAALMARGFTGAGLHCRFATDTECRSASRVALDQAGAADVPIDALSPGGSADNLDRSLAAGGDRLGDRHRALRTRRGWSRPKHARRRCQCPCRTARPVVQCRSLANHRDRRRRQRDRHGRRSALVSSPSTSPLGEVIGCVVPADHLITAGVSHWGAYALLAALAMLRPDWTAAMLARSRPGVGPRRGRGDGAGWSRGRRRFAAPGGDDRCACDGGSPPDAGCCHGCLVGLT